MELNLERKEVEANDSKVCHVLVDGSPAVLCGTPSGYGITLAQFRLLSLHQNGRCISCGWKACLTCDLLASQIHHL